MAILFSLSIFLYANNSVTADINKIKKVYRDNGFNEIGKDIQNVENKIIAKNIRINDFDNICLFYKNIKNALQQTPINSQAVKIQNSKLINSANTIVKQCLSNDVNQITKALLDTMSQQKSVFDELSKKSDEHKIFNLSNNWSKLTLAVVLLSFTSIIYLFFYKPSDWFKKFVIEAVFLLSILIFIIKPQFMLRFLT